ncbi:MAG: AsmA family protein [Alistipes sp.]|nr:AsmA family protein [Alistipes sp.]
MKKLLKITSVVVVLIVVLLLVLPMAFKGKIEAIVKQEGNKMLNAQFDFKSLDISLLRYFPQASVTLEDFWLKGVDEFENDTLVYAGELTAAVNVMSLFGDSGFEVSKIVVDDTRLHAIVLEDGKPNWDVMKATEETEEAIEEESGEPSSFKIQLKKLAVNNLDVVYDDRQGDMYAEVLGFDASCAGNFASESTTLRLAAETPSLTFRMGGVPFLNKAEIEANMDVAADFVNSKFTLNENKIRLNAIEAAIDGWVAMLESGMDMDLTLISNEIGFKEILSLIPAIYAKDFAGLRADGVATLNASAKGRMEGDMLPAFDVDLNVKNAMFRYPSLPAGVDNINVAATVKNPGGTMDATVVNVNPFSFVLAGNPFSVVANITTPISDLAFDVAAKGKLDLGKIKDVYPIEDMNLNGLVNADLGVKGRMSYIDKSQYDLVQASGSVTLDDMAVQLKDIPDVLIKHSVLAFNPRYVELSKTTVNIGENDITLDSRFENYLGFVFKGTTLKGELNVQSNRMNLNDFLGGEEATENETAEEDVAEQTESAPLEEVVRVPDNIDFRMQTSFKEVLFNKMTFTDFNGLLTIKNSKINMQNLSLKTMGGSAVVNGSYATPTGQYPSLNAGFSLSEIGFAQAYNDLDIIRKLAPIFSGLTGNFSGTIRVDTKLDANMDPVINTFNAYGALSTKDLSLQKMPFLDQIADIVKKPSLKNTKVKDLNIDFTVDKGRVHTKPFTLKVEDYVMVLSGSTGLDQTIDYRGTITIPDSAGKVAKLGTVDMTIGGTFKSPKVGIDMESLAKKAASNALQELGNKLLGGKKQESPAESGDASTASATEDATEETPQTEQEKKVEDVKTLVNVAKGLFKKKN